MLSDRIEDCILRLNTFDISVWKADWESGYIVLGLDKEELCEITDYTLGIIVFTRDYICGEWDYNYWSMRIYSCDQCGFCCTETQILSTFHKELQESSMPYPSMNSATKEMYNTRMAIEEDIRRYKTEVMDKFTF